MNGGLPLVRQTPGYFSTITSMTSWKLNAPGIEPDGHDAEPNEQSQQRPPDRVTVDRVARDH